MQTNSIQVESANSDRKVVISCENVHKTYLMGIEGVAALRGVSLDIYEGEFAVIFGTSGGGKTTMLNILGTIDTATKGNVVVLGQRVASHTPDEDLARVRLESIGFVFQSFNLLSTMTASENVELPMILYGKLNAEQRKNRVKELLTSVGLEHRLNHLPSQMSGGEQQRATIARALANEPSVLLMDEPTGDLDTKNTLIVLDILMNLNMEKGITICMVTHDTNMKQYAHRAVYMRDGKLHQIENIDPDRRQAAIQQLQLDVEQIRKAGSHGSQYGGGGGGITQERRQKSEYRIAAALRPAATVGERSGGNMNDRTLMRLFGVTPRQITEMTNQEQQAGDREMRPLDPAHVSAPHPVQQSADLLSPPPTAAESNRLLGDQPPQQQQQHIDHF